MGYDIATYGIIPIVFVILALLLLIVCGLRLITAIFIFGLMCYVLMTYGPDMADFLLSVGTPLKE